MQYFGRGKMLPGTQVGKTRRIIVINPCVLLKQLDF